MTHEGNTPRTDESAPGAPEGAANLASEPAGAAGPQPPAAAVPPGAPPVPPGAPPAPPAAPLVPWDAPAAAAPVLVSGGGSYGGEQPPFTVGALLSDTFARYGADLLRLFVISLVASALSWVSSFIAPMTAGPLGRPTGFVDVSGLLGLLSFVVGFVGSSTTFALAEGGPAVRWRVAHLERFRPSRPEPVHRMAEA